MYLGLERPKTYKNILCFQLFGKINNVSFLFSLYLAVNQIKIQFEVQIPYQNGNFSKSKVLALAELCIEK